MNKAKLLKQLREDVFTRLGPSPIHGVGVFAIRPIPEGTNPFRGDTMMSNPVRISVKDMLGVPDTVRTLVHDLCVRKEGFYLVPDTGIDSVTKAWLVNHSSNPNMREHNHDFITIRNIEAGEELTVDYTTYSEDVNLQTTEEKT